MVGADPSKSRNEEGSQPSKPQQNPMAPCLASETALVADCRGQGA